MGSNDLYTLMLRQAQHEDVVIFDFLILSLSKDEGSARPIGTLAR